jgi:O-antigen/teichoic acid export membrane protein
MYSTAFNFLGSPIASRIEKDGSATEAVRMFRSIARWLAIASVFTLVPLGVFATEFIAEVYHPRYAAGGPVLALLAIGYGLSNVLSIHNPILAALGRSKILSINSTLAAISNVVLNILLIPQYGIIGAATATAVSFSLRDGLAALEVYLGVGQSPLSWRAIQPIIVAGPFLLGTLSVKSAVSGTLPWLIVASGIAASIYIMSLLMLFGLSSTEAMIVRSAQERAGIDWYPLNRLIDILER